MKILGIDYGRKKIGLATATSILAEPYQVVRYETIGEAIKKIRQVVEKEEIKKIVIGISEGQMGEETKRFAKILGKELGVTPEFQDESLSSFDARTLSIQEGTQRKKRREFEDAYAAAIMLQSYLESSSRQ